MNDIRFALRQMLKNPVFTGLGVLTIALGIGVNTAVFSITKEVLVHPLGFDQADQLIWIRLNNKQSGVLENRLSWQEMEDIRQTVQGIESIATFGMPGGIWERDGHYQEVAALQVTPQLPIVLRVQPILGRMLEAHDARNGAEPVALIGEEIWESHFGRDPEILDRTVRIDNQSRRIVGVLPKGLKFPLEGAPSPGTGGQIQNGIQAFWFPLQEPEGLDRTSREARMFLLVARLKPAVTRHSVRAELGVLSQRLESEFPESYKNLAFDLMSFRDEMLGNIRTGLPVLALAVGAVLMICCVNLSNILLARGVARQRELSMRVWMGARGRDLIWTLMSESILISMAGGLLGVFLAYGLLQGIGVCAPKSVPLLAEAELDGLALGFSVGVSVLVGWASGMMPVLCLTRTTEASGLQVGARSTVSPRIDRWQRRLLVGQVASVMVLSLSALLLLESFRRLIGQDLGYQPDRVVMLDLATFNLESNAEGSRIYREIKNKISLLPGVEAVGTIQSTPLTGKWTFHERAQAVGAAMTEMEQPLLAGTFVAFDYFRAMGIPLIAGRTFREDELLENDFSSHVILNEMAVATLFGGETAVGRRISFGNRSNRYYEVIGVVRDTVDVRLEASAEPRYYLHYAFGGAQVAVRCRMDPRAMIPVLRSTLEPFASRVLLREINPLAEIVSETVSERRFLLILLSGYAVLALLVAGAGIFGVVGHQVARRSKEFGVRMALGATLGDLEWEVVRRTGRVILTGLVVGAVMSFWTSQLLTHQLFRTKAQDPYLLAGAGVAILAVSLLACYLPARRVSKVDPMQVLREE